MNQMLKRVSALAAALALTLCACAGAETLFEGVVTSSGATPVLAAFGAAVDQMNVSPGDRVEKGQTVAQLRTTRVYAPCEGTVSGVFGAEGDLTDGVNERYGAVLYVEPLGKYTVSATTEKAYNISENRFVHIGETVFLRCVSDGSHQGRGVVKGYGDDTSKYNVEVIAGEFCIQETVAIYRDENYDAKSCIGRGDVAATTPVAVKGSGSILKMHVKNGDSVERGELLFETVDGALDGMYSPGSQVVSDVSGIVATVDAQPGASVEKGGKILTVYTDESLQVQLPVAEADLSLIQVGQKVRLEFTWDPNQTTVFEGEVVSLSYLNANAAADTSTGGTSTQTTDPVYTAIVSFTPDSTVRMGMTVLAYVQD